jgi:hypothetical protein
VLAAHHQELKELLEDQGVTGVKAGELPTRPTGAAAWCTR